MPIRSFNEAMTFRSWKSGGKVTFIEFKTRFNEAMTFRSWKWKMVVCNLGSFFRFNEAMTFRSWKFTNQPVFRVLRFRFNEAMTFRSWKSCPRKSLRSKEQKDVLRALYNFLHFRYLSHGLDKSILPYISGKTVLRAVLGFFLPPNRSFDLFPLLALSRHKRGVIPNLAGQTPR